MSEWKKHDYRGASLPERLRKNEIPYVQKNPRIHSRNGENVLLILVPSCPAGLN